MRFPLIVLIVYLHTCGVTANFSDGARSLSAFQVADAIFGFTRYPIAINSGSSAT